MFIWARADFRKAHIFQTVGTTVKMILAAAGAVLPTAGKQWPRPDLDGRRGSNNSPIIWPARIPNGIMVFVFPENPWIQSGTRASKSPPTFTWEIPQALSGLLL